MWSGRYGRTWLALVAMAAASLTPAVAGTLSVRWDAVSDSDVAGYRVYYGTTPGSHAQMYDAGNTTSATLGNVSDCTIYYVTVRAYDTGGLESATDSNSVKGFARPVVSTVNPTSLTQGQSKSFTISGTNFDAGVTGDATRPPARVKVSGAGLTVSSTTVNACGQITTTIAASATATTGWSSLTVENADLSYSDPANHPWVFGTLTQAINVVAGDTVAPTISATSPAAGATNVATSVKPTVTFSEAMSASSVTSSTVLLLDASNVIVAQAAGSPSTSGSVVTISPAAALASGKTYHIKVVGGASGVKDLAGNALASDFNQSPGFTTASSGGSNTDPVSVVSSSPANNATGVAYGTSVVTITYSRDISVLWSTLTRGELQQSFRVSRNGRALFQAATSPSISSNGTVVTITLRSAIDASSTYRTEAGPLNAKGQNALRNAGIQPGVLAQLWRVQWTTQAALQSAARRDAKTGSNLTTLTVPEDPATTPAENTNVPVQSEFVLNFNQKLDRTRLSSANFRIVDSSNAEVRQSVAPKLENGDLRVVLTPAEPLDYGRKYRVVVRTGSSGARLVAADGTPVEIGDGTPMVVPVATQVGASGAPAVAP